MGFHPGSSSFDAHAADRDKLRWTMWRSAEPIVLDRAAESYSRFVGEVATNVMARKHSPLWRDALFAQPAAVSLVADDLSCVAADAFGLALLQASSCAAVPRPSA